MEHTGIDVHEKDSQIFILTEQGELLERRVRTEPGRFGEGLPRPPEPSPRCLGARRGPVLGVGLGYPCRGGASRPCSMA
jgi:hypothetical protein